MNQRIGQNLQELYKMRARLRSQIARLDSQITALDGGPVANLHRIAAGSNKRASRLPHFQPADERA